MGRFRPPQLEPSVQILSSGNLCRCKGTSTGRVGGERGAGWLTANQIKAREDRSWGARACQGGSTLIGRPPTASTSARASCHPPLTSPTTRSRSPAHPRPLDHRLGCLGRDPRIWVVGRPDRGPAGRGGSIVWNGLWFSPPIAPAAPGRSSRTESTDRRCEKKALPTLKTRSPRGMICKLDLTPCSHRSNMMLVDSAAGRVTGTDRVFCHRAPFGENHGKRQ